MDVPMSCRAHVELKFDSWIGAALVRPIIRDHRTIVESLNVKGLSTMLSHFLPADTREKHYIYKLDFFINKSVATNASPLG